MYAWADGIPLEDDKQCIPVLIGATPEGSNELVGFTNGRVEEDLRDLLLDLMRRGLDVRPKLAIAGRPLRFWNTAGEM